MRSNAAAPAPTSRPIMIMSGAVRVISILLVLSRSTRAKLADRSRMPAFRANGEGSNDAKMRAGSTFGSAGKRRGVTQKSKINVANASLRRAPVSPGDVDMYEAKIGTPPEESGSFDPSLTVDENAAEFERKLSSQLTGCCSDYKAFSAANLCAMYGQDCESGEVPSSDSGDDGNCQQDGHAFIGLSFSVNSAYGNPYSYRLNEQLPTERIIDRDYKYVMSMDEDGWLVGGGYKTFDYSGKMPYIDSAHAEILKIGNLNPAAGGTTINQVYRAMEYVSPPPISVFPENIKAKMVDNDNDNSGACGNFAHIA